MAEHTVMKRIETTVKLSDGEKILVTRCLIDVDAGYTDDMTYEEIKLERVDDDGVTVFRVVADDAEKLKAFLKRKL